MNRFVLDASALLALLLGESGADRVKAALDGSVMSTVNVDEVVSHYAKLGAGRQDIEALLRSLPIRLVFLDTVLSYDAGMLRPSRSKAACRSATAAAWPWPGARVCPPSPRSDVGRSSPRRRGLRSRRSAESVPATVRFRVWLTRARVGASLPEHLRSRI